MNAAAPFEIWAGPECTVNRVGDCYFDQLERSGHARRLSDLDLFADLKVAALRYPVLWERVAPRGLASASWSWSRERLERLRELGIRPIAGLLHHGAGPAHATFGDARFPAELAAYARAVAEHFPWIDEWSPINEPVTTARFSGLYGLWHPHGRDTRSFVRILLHQCQGIALAMREIRQVNPGAKLILPEEMGRIRATPHLAHQAAYENHRRLLGLDLLTGRVGPAHPLWRHLLEEGATRAELETFLDSPTPPDIIGVNYYLTSDRFLDERLELHPARSHGGNGRERYADVEAVRVAGVGLTGHRAILEELWQRYRIPLALTEVHAACTREEQLRWLHAAWLGARAAASSGVDVRAVTAWSLLGSFDWDKLVVRLDGSYEPGVFDLRGRAPRPTALARHLRVLSRGGEPDHPVLAVPGWWERLGSTRESLVRGRPIAVIGATGTLGQAIARICAKRGLPHRLLSRSEIDISNARSVDACLEAVDPWAVINAAGYVRVDDAEDDAERCWRENVLGPTHLARAARARKIPLLTFSSDLVFSGDTDRPYVESDLPAPLGRYGATKLEAERAVLDLWPEALVIRSAAFFGPRERHSFVAHVLQALQARRPIRALRDVVVSPTYVPDLADAALDLLIDGECGIWHLANQGSVTWAEFAARTVQLAGSHTSLVESCSWEALGLRARRPRFSSLGSERGVLLRSLEAALQSFFADRAVHDR
jgi:dTDP-4-dehydrorhamnose reductase